VLRRRLAPASARIGRHRRFLGVEFELGRHHLRGAEGEVIQLTPGELSVLSVLIENPGRVMSRDELLEEVGIPLTPVRLKCALLGLGVLKVALHKGKGTPLPDEWAGLEELELS